MAEECKICELSINDINALSKEEAEKIALSGKLCVKHMVTHLNVRKGRAFLIGKELLLAIKESAE
jgi:hypothetical protein